MRLHIQTESIGQVHDFPERFIIIITKLINLFSTGSQDFPVNCPLIFIAKLPLLKLLI